MMKRIMSNSSEHISIARRAKQLSQELEEFLNDAVESRAIHVDMVDTDFDRYITSAIAELEDFAFVVGKIE